MKRNLKWICRSAENGNFSTESYMYLFLNPHHTYQSILHVVSVGVIIISLFTFFLNQARNVSSVHLDNWSKWVNYVTDEKKVDYVADIVKFNYVANMTTVYYVANMTKVNYVADMTKANYFPFPLQKAVLKVSSLIAVTLVVDTCISYVGHLILAILLSCSCCLQSFLLYM